MRLVKVEGRTSMERSLLDRQTGRLCPEERKLGQK